MSRQTITGIDIGTYQVKVVIAEAGGRGDKGLPKVLGVGVSESKGLRHGYIVNVHEVADSIRAAISEAEKRAEVKVKRAFVSVGGIGVGSVVSSSSIIISRADSEITALDVKKVLDQCQKDIPVGAIVNRKILHSIPLQYKIDGKVVLGSPETMKGNKLEVKILFVTCLEHHLNDIVHAVEEAGVVIQDVCAAPIAAGFVTLSKAQKVAGVVLANIGAETVSIAVFENNIPVSLEIFAIGSTDITNDIALGLKVPLEEAEQIKVGAVTGSSYPRKKLEEIIEARLSDIFELIEAHLKKIGRNGLLPAGVVITGGGAGLGTIEDMARAALRLPSRIGTIITTTAPEKLQDRSERPRERQTFRDATWAVAYGLCILGAQAEDGPIIGAPGMMTTSITKLTAWMKRFLP